MELAKKFCKKYHMNEKYINFIAEQITCNINRIMEKNE